MWYIWYLINIYFVTKKAKHSGLLIGLECTRTLCRKYNREYNTKVLYWSTLFNKGPEAQTYNKELPANKIASSAAGWKTNSLREGIKRSCHTRVREIAKLTLSPITISCFIHFSQSALLNVILISLIRFANVVVWVRWFPNVGTNNFINHTLQG